MNFFSENNKVIAGINKIIDCVWLSILWFLCSIPIITIGASTTALYYTMNKVIRNDRGYVAPEFFSCFRRNFKHATVIWILFLALYIFLGYDYLIMKQAMSLGEKTGYLYHAFLIFIVLLTLWGLYIFPYIARFENTIKETLRNSLYIAVCNIHWTILLAVLFIAAFVLIYMFSPVLVVMPSLYHLFKNLIIEHVFKKYMSPEDIEAEKERNQTYY